MTATVPKAMKTRRRTTTEDDLLLPVLERARAVGFLGPGPLRVHIDHARQYVDALPPLAPGDRIIDLGSGGGLPGLPLFLAQPQVTGALLDASTKRCAFLLWAREALGLGDRVEVIEGRAEEVAHQPSHRFGYAAVVARGFGPPSSTVECGCGFLQPGGRIIISEPPDRRPWAAPDLAAIGLSVDESHAGVVTFDTSNTDRDVNARDRLPRPIKQQRRSPLFTL